MKTLYVSDQCNFLKKIFSLNNFLILSNVVITLQLWEVIESCIKSKFFNNKLFLN